MTSARTPIDPRLWRYARSTRPYLLLSVGCSLVGSGGLIGAAVSLGHVLAGVVTRPESRTIGAWYPELSWLAAMILVRTAATWCHARIAHRAGSTVVAELQNSVLAAASELPMRELAKRRAELVVLLSSGLPGLRSYLVEYLPALFQALLVPPAIILVIALYDPTSAVIVLLTLPLIPLFMILIGRLTEGRAAASAAATIRFTDQVLDLFAGMATLRALHRENNETDPALSLQPRVRALGEALQRRTLSALRIALLSGMVLEMLTTLSVALVAVSIGLRLVFGGMSLGAGVVALLLAPEVYWPLRQVGERFHAGQDGWEAAQAAFSVLDGRRPRQMVPGTLSELAKPGEITVLTGPNGSGKSTACAVFLGLLPPGDGPFPVDSTRETHEDISAWWSRIAWLPQHPGIIAGTVRENMEFFGADLAKAESACEATGFDAVLAELPYGWDTLLAAGGSGLSLGQRQRLALTRVLAAERPLLVLDEPTAHLDEKSADKVAQALIARAEAGATVIIAAHRPALVAIADRIHPMTSTPQVVPS